MNPLEQILNYEATGIAVLDADRGFHVPGGVRDYMLTRAQEWTRDDDLIAEWLEDGRLTAEKKECFRNAAENAIANPELTYVEGYAMPQVVDMPMAHAWNVDADGNVIDPTWENGGKAYYGIEFETAELCALLIKTEHYGFLCRMYDRKVREALGIE